ncbi:MAG: ubiquinone/menaquinone biosynthesis methyltransferase [marine bacterium B5-7]|nr:MAG: ubiquinone/menaquinone biosynthesis methyltransferase [marine bacterium B5-7]
MTLTKSIETGQVNRSAADVYEEFFVPALFQRWTEPVAQAAQVKQGDDVLDIACGTGVLARRLAARVGKAGKVTGLDINDGMLDIARKHLSSIFWRQGDAEALPFDDNRFDAVVCQFGLMFFQDRKQALREMVRVLRPGHKLAVAVWDTLDNTPGYAATSGLLHRLFGASVAESLRSPYVLGDTKVLVELFNQPGLSEVLIDTREGLAEFDSIEDWMHTDIRGWTLAGILDDDQYALLLKEAKAALKKFVGSDGRVVFKAPAHIVTGTKSLAV